MKKRKTADEIYKLLVAVQKKINDEIEIKIYDHGNRTIVFFFQTAKTFNMKRIILFILAIGLTTTLNAQAPGPSRDSLKKALSEATDDYVRFGLIRQLGESYVYRFPDSAVIYAEQSMLLARKLKSDSLLFHALALHKILSQLTGNYSQALHYSFEELKAAERTKNFILIGKATNSLGDLYRDQGDYARALFYAQKAKFIFDAHFTYSFTAVKNNNDTLNRYGDILHILAVAFEKNDRLDSALKYIQMTEQLTIKQQGGKMPWPAVPFCYGNIYSKMSDYPKAIRYYQWGISIAIQRDIKKDIMDNGYGLANVYKKMNQPDSGIYYANKVLQASKFARHPLMQLNALTLLADVYKSKQNIDSTAKYFELALVMKDSLFNQDKVMQMQNQTFNEQERQQDLIAQETSYGNRLRMNAILGITFTLLLTALLLWRNNRHKQKAKIKIEEAYKELKATQSQLIQSEKMASLGELTAGIAHEIQNPLNFVNNFSEVNKELLTEMKDEIDKGNYSEVKTIAKDVIENHEKINHHGKRADAIVKGMLQHSRASTGYKEPTDINALCDEYLRLCFHGLRAKDKSFNVIMKTDFDNSIEKINVIPQDIGRVVLNLLTNAFYAVDEKMKTGHDCYRDENYEPTVSISTKKIGDKVEIKVSDNGIGIPQKVLDKIFQPFFTTKPTGQGTGLGLSLSYDIIKAHGGEIKVETKEDEGTEFTIQLPVR